MQSLNISAAALRSVQNALDNTANNLANVDTVGYKRRSVSFSELLTDSMNDQPVTDKGSRSSAPGLRIGSGVKTGMTRIDMSQGSVKTTDVPSDLMIDGEGFFLVRFGNEYRLTRNGHFHFQRPAADGPIQLVTANGGVLVDDLGNPIEIQGEGSIEIQRDGQILVNGEPDLYGAHIPVFQVPDPDQYIQVGDNEYLLNDPVANPPALNILNINPANPESAPVIRQGALEVSNVDPNQEMSQLVVQQRAFQLNSRAIAISDQMMGIANSLRSR